VDKRLQKIIDENAEYSATAQSLLGKIAIGNAKLAYEMYKTVFFSDRFLKLRQKGAKIQRPLWASTSTKNPAYRDVIYVEELIGPDTVNTIPPQTLVAFLDHGVVADTLEKDVDAASQVMNDLEILGISMKQVTDELLDEGVKAFADAFDVLLEAIETRRKA